ncbi:MAG TPA: MBL fold metallo-hydrolase [Gemmatimonadaceae bacterium]|nr:MBL fold metallo-hydrolase [Gemmatimonadaceae bacterium]
MLRNNASRVVLLALGLIASPCGAQRAMSGVQLKYLGTAGWEVTNGTTVVLIDPYLTRANQITPNDTVLPTDTRPLFSSDSIARSDTATIDAHIRRADFILITHTHQDHVLDVPYIAAKTGAMIIGTESTFNFARALGVPSNKIIVVRGGEDYEFGAVSIKVIPSLHGVLRRAPYLVRNPNAPLPPAVFPSNAKPPFRMGDLRIEGGTLACLIRIGGRQVLAFGSMNYIEREVEGLRPDVALIGAMPERREIYDYTARLLRALGNPPMVLPTHWDRFNVTYDVSQEPAIKRLQTFIAEVKAASPKTRVVVPKYFEPVLVP